jgi:hypothetical protein
MNAVEDDEDPGALLPRRTDAQLHGGQARQDTSCLRISSERANSNE